MGYLRGEQGSPMGYPKATRIGEKFPESMPQHFHGVVCKGLLRGQHWTPKQYPWVTTQALTHWVFPRFTLWLMRRISEGRTHGKGEGKAKGKEQAKGGLWISRPRFALCSLNMVYCISPRIVRYQVGGPKGVHVYVHSCTGLGTQSSQGTKSEAGRRNGERLAWVLLSKFRAKPSGMHCVFSPSRIRLWCTSVRPWFRSPVIGARRGTEGVLGVSYGYPTGLLGILQWV